MPDNTHTRLFEPHQLGHTTLRNRTVLAPMTRVSAEPDGTVSDRIEEYYRVFAAGGFAALITEGLYIDTEHSPGYFGQPGIATDAHVQSWRKITDVVHNEGSAIIAQLMHAGPQAQGNPFGLGPIGPTDKPARGEQLPFYGGSGPYPTPSAMTADDIDRTRQAFVDSALRARDAGFDGVELHGANGYLLDAFLTDYLNDRDDQYGGSPRNRVRLTVEICEAVRDAVGEDFIVGVRLSQGKVSDHAHKWSGGADEAEAILTELATTTVDYVHTTEPVASAPAFEDDPRSLATLAAQFTNATIIANGNINTPEEASTLLDRNGANLVALGKPALANRNWPERVRTDAPLNAPFVPLEGGLADIEDWEIDANSLLNVDDPTR
ncbi:NADH:flavin oxidoreductase [Actinopolyspora saharensis]|uniref:2,4-dienoyl-CoA reductase n=1 Tax=Actinopolyspora saharensis TaxID=995062 RepID=A0A1H0ZNT0_9ACTN|nr:NADH:flavin oxidoreductase [Actinopolyspora saharensis]SDQ28989.1 2,4-dienoyl-CoA reductase [Actinopolyspora saharensis]